jgi:hypothetical protein
MVIVLTNGPKVESDGFLRAKKIPLHDLFQIGSKAIGLMS